MSPNIKPESGRGTSRGVQPPGWAVPIVNFFDSIFGLLFLVAVVSLVVLLAMLFLGKTNLPWLPTLLSVFSFCLVAGFLAVLIARYDSVKFGWVGVVVGLAFLFGGPLAIAVIARAGGIRSDAANPFVTNLLGSISTLGVVLITIAVLNLVLGYAIQLMYMEGAQGAKQLKFANQPRTKGTKPSMVPKCWEMSRCRPGVRESCPNFVDKHNCWKRRSGCFCDRDLANYLVGAVDRGEAAEVIEMQTVTATATQKATAIRSHMQDTGRRSWRQQSILCHACPLYLEHQEYKYKYWHWVSFPATLVLLVICYPIFHICYAAVLTFLNDVLLKLVKMGGLSDNFVPTTAGLADNGFEYVVLAVLGILVASYVMALTDTFFLKWKL